MSHAFLKRTGAALLSLAFSLFAQVPDTIVVMPRASTAPVITDADDPAIWMHPTDPAKTLIIGTDKGAYPDGGLFSWNLDGTQKQRISLDNPNNVDVRYGLRLGGQLVDIAAASMRDLQQVRIFKIDAGTRRLSDITTLDSANVLNKMFKLPYGLTLYKRPTDDFIFAIVSSRHSESKDKLWQIRLEDDGAGRVKGALVRQFGAYKNVVEGMVADDELGYFYAAEEKAGIHKYYADPQRGNARLAFFGSEDSLAGNYEGMAVYKCSDRTGYLFIARPSLDCIKVYRREGEENNPHRHLLVTKIMDANGEAGDGIEVINRPNGPTFPHGFLVWQNQKARAFRLYGWEDIAQKFLKICSSNSGSTAVEDGAVDSRASAPILALKQNYPNPFNPETDIRFVLKQAGPVQLTIYNVLGEAIRQLLNTRLGAGAHTASWDAKNDTGAPVGSGVYFYQLRADNLIETRRMVLSR